MPLTITTKPTTNEYAPYYQTYIGKLPEQELLKLLSDQLEQTCALLAAVPETQGDATYAPGKWSIKEVAGHIGDTERIMAYRLLRIARGDVTPLPGFEQDDYVRTAAFSSVALADLIADLRLVRASTLSLLRVLDEAALGRRGVANGFPVSARALAYIIAGHERHHADILRSQYRLGERAASSS